MLNNCLQILCAFNILESIASVSHAKFTSIPLPNTWNHQRHPDWWIDALFSLTLLGECLINLLVLWARKVCTQHQTPHAIRITSNEIVFNLSEGKC